MKVSYWIYIYDRWYEVASAAYNAYTGRKEIREDLPFKKHFLNTDIKDGNCNFYFTFGSEKKFPFTNGYIVIRAKAIENARHEFKKLFPNTNKDVLNCSFYYTESEWNSNKNKLNRQIYGDPFVVLTARDMQITIDIDIYNAKRTLIISAGSIEQENRYKYMTEMEIKDEVLKHIKCWGITEVG